MHCGALQAQARVVSAFAEDASPVNLLFATNVGAEVRAWRRGFGGSSFANYYSAFRGVSAQTEPCVWALHD
jgi:hypothetical protein